MMSAMMSLKLAWRTNEIAGETRKVFLPRHGHVNFYYQIYDLKILNEPQQTSILKRRDLTAPS
jgi:hypothetical protein